MEQTIINSLDKLGFPAALLLLVAFYLSQAAKWFAPRVDKVVDATTENTASLKVLDAKINANHEHLKEVLIEVRRKVDQVLEYLADERGEKE